MANTHRAIIVARAAVVNTARQRAAEAGLDPVGGLAALDAPLSLNGQFPAQAYWCSWGMTAAQYAQAQNRIEGFDPTRIRLYDGNTWTPEAVLADLAAAGFAVRPVDG